MQPEDFLGKGLDLKPDGGWYCRFREIAVQEIDKHLRPYYNAAKRKHRHYRDCVWRCAQKLPQMSVQLKYEKIVFRKGQFSCEFCKKSGPWYKLVEEIKHLANKAHRAAAGPFPHRPTDVEVEAWQRVLQGRGGLRAPIRGPGVHRGIRGVGQEAAAAAPAKPLALAPQAEAALAAAAARPRRPSPRRREAAVARAAAQAVVAKLDVGKDLPKVGVYFPSFPRGPHLPPRIPRTRRWRLSASRCF